MLPDVTSHLGDNLHQRIAEAASAVDEESAFPSSAFEVLRNDGWIANPPIARGQAPLLLRLLVQIGRGDLSTGRIYEGHVNACWLIETYGSRLQRSKLGGLLHRGELLGVWNTDVPHAPLYLSEGRLSGRKNFASGADGLTHAIVTVTDQRGRHMLLVPLSGSSVDRTWWVPLGMRGSGSHVVDFSGLTVADDSIIGESDDYIAQPWFTAGAARFLAVQLGGVHRILDIAREHLTRTQRVDNPYQLHRLARMGAAVETGYLWIDRLSCAWLEAEARGDDENYASLMAAVNGARLVIERLAMDVLGEAEQAIGAAGMIAPHPFERQMRDLRTYLRQPNPDGAASQFGGSVASETWRPGHLR